MINIGVVKGIFNSFCISVDGIMDIKCMLVNLNKTEAI